MSKLLDSALLQMQYSEINDLFNNDEKKDETDRGKPATTPNPIERVPTKVLELSNYIQTEAFTQKKAANSPQSNMNPNKEEKYTIPIGIAFNLERFFDINLTELSCNIQGILTITFAANESDYQGINTADKETFESKFNPLLFVRLANGDTKNDLQFHDFEIVKEYSIYKNNLIGKFRFEKKHDLNCVIAAKYDLFGTIKQNFNLKQYSFDSQYINVRIKNINNGYILTPLLWTENHTTNSFFINPDSKKNNYGGMEFNENLLSEYCILDSPENCYQAIYTVNDVVFSVSVIRQ